MFKERIIEELCHRYFPIVKVEEIYDHIESEDGWSTRLSLAGLDYSYHLAGMTLNEVGKKILGEVLIEILPEKKDLISKYLHLNGGAWEETSPEEIQDLRNAITEWREKKEQEENKLMLQQWLSATIFEIREVRIDRRGQYHKPVLNCMLIGGLNNFTPLSLQYSLLNLVNKFGRDSKAYVIYAINGSFEEPLIIAETKEELLAVLPKVEAIFKKGENIQNSLEEIQSELK